MCLRPIYNITLKHRPKSELRKNGNQYYPEGTELLGNKMRVVTTYFFFTKVIFMIPIIFYAGTLL